MDLENTLLYPLSCIGDMDLEITIEYRNRLDKLTDLQILPTRLLNKITKNFHLQLKIFGLIGKNTIERGHETGRNTRWRHHH